MTRFMTGLARAMAIIGGLVLTILVIVVCVSVLGRGGDTLAHWDWLEQSMPWLSNAILGLGLGPVPGDFELVEAGIAFAVFSFLPLCQINGGHATVDVFTAQFPRRFTDWLITFWEVVLTALILLITWRLFVGMLDKIDNGETTFILQFPIWWAYAASVIAAVAASLVAIYCAIGRIIEITTHKPVLPNSEGAVH